MSEELRPCPFCGGEAAIYEPLATSFWFVRCSDGDTCSTCGPDRETRSAAIEAWNTRAEKKCRMVRKPTIDPYTDRAVCSGCGKSVPVSVGERMPNYCPNCGAKVVG